MDIDMNRINEIIEKISSADDIQLSDIPYIDLYMDQITTLFEDKLSDTKRDADEKILTKTMINNYTKAKALLPPKNKKYSKSHIILMALIYNMKQVLSINDIKLVLTPILSRLNTSNASTSDLLEKIYGSFLDIKKQDLKDLKNDFGDTFHVVSNKTENVELEDKDLASLILLVLTLTEQAALQKQLAESIVDHFFKAVTK